jgi:squalene-hopene/tetraprenyl-beta-curcumene cyclase
MTATVMSEQVGTALAAARGRLLEARAAAGHWEGRLSPSALSTAVACTALELVRRAGCEALAPLVRAGLQWLADHPNADGGFGDTPDSPTNISTTTLCWAALGLSPEFAGPAERARLRLQHDVGPVTAASLAEAIGRRYGEDRTFSAPILTLAALAGRFGEGPAAWACVPQLPFELAALPRAWFPLLNLQVVSYALPALIAIGLAHHVNAPTGNPLSRALRTLARDRTLRILESIQPSSGGFLEAIPLTSFVTMSLAGSARADHPVARRGVEFLQRSVRPDGSWPIDVDLATWVTTQSLEALSRAGPIRETLGEADRAALRRWLLGQQTRGVHPYTGSAPGGWAWTDRPGGVPDADDTSGALVALSLLAEGEDEEVRRAALAGVRWLLDVQNADGGVPTFCRGWGKLPFDRSCPDITAHALRAWNAWRPRLDGALARRVDEATARAFGYLLASQRPDGSWIPLWFGNQAAPDQTNPVYGTSRVLVGAESPPASLRASWSAAARRAVAWLAAAQQADGGYGSIEETALALEALAGYDGGERAAEAACRWLVRRTDEGTRFEAAPIGLYFARLWYAEALYPLIFTVGALGRAVRGGQRC